MVLMEQIFVPSLWVVYVAWSRWEKKALNIYQKQALVVFKLVKFFLARFFANSAWSNIYTSVCFATISVNLDVQEKLMPPK